MALEKHDCGDEQAFTLANISLPISWLRRVGPQASNPEFWAYYESKQNLMNFFTNNSHYEQISAAKFLAPWFDIFDHASSINFGCFDDWKKLGTNYHRLEKDPSKADWHILYADYRDIIRAGKVDQAQKDFDSARRHSKPIIIFCGGDETEKIQWPENSVVFRYAISKDTRTKHELSLPHFHHDILVQLKSNPIPARQKTQAPTVGFCGYAPPLNTPWSRQRVKDLIKMAYYLVRQTPANNRTAHAIRPIAISRLKFSKQDINTNFLVRESFAFNRWGVLQPGGSPASAEQQRNEYIHNILHSDYTLCIRGIANCSIRLYETLCCGRLPLLINTTCVFPAEQFIDYGKLGLIVNENKLHQLDKLLSEFHDGISQEDFIEKQLNARKIWQNWLSPVGFYGKLDTISSRHLAATS